MEMILRQYPFSGAWHRPPCDGPATRIVPAMRSASRTERSLHVVDPLPYMLPKGSLSHPAPIVFDQGENRHHTTKATMASGHFRTLMTTEGGS
jgi:hypothetical protein